MLKSSNVDLNFYLQLCKLLEFCNDFFYYFNIDQLIDSEIINLINKVSYSTNSLVDTEMLILVYPMHLKEHIHYFIYCKKFGLDISILNKHFSQLQIKRNEFSDEIEVLLDAQIKFLNGNSQYKIDMTQARWKIASYDDILKSSNATISLNAYLSKIHTCKGNAFDLLLEELITEVRNYV